MCISLRTYPRAFQMQEARSPAYLSSWSLTTLTYLGAWVTRLGSWLVIAFGWCGCRWCSTDSSSNSRLNCITRTLTWGSLKDNSVRVLPDLLNSCPSWHCVQGHQGSHPGKHMLAAAPLASCMFSDWGRQAAGWGSISQDLLPLQTEERSFSALRCIKTYLRWSTMAQQHLNNRMLLDQCPQGSDGWIGFAHHRQAVRERHAMNAAGVSLALCTVHSDTHQSDWGLTLS